MTMGRRKSTNWKLRLKAKKSLGEAPWGLNDDGKKKNRMGREGKNQVRSMSKQGQRGAVSIDFKAFARKC